MITFLYYKFGLLVVHKLRLRSSARLLRVLYYI